MTKNMLQTNLPLSKPAAVCVASDDLLLCADDGHRVVYQIQLERNGVTRNGKLRKLIYQKPAYKNMWIKNTQAEIW